jgi:GTP-binding protein
LVLLTKSDKLNRSEAQAALAEAQQTLAELTTEEADVNVALFSALKKSGVGDAATLLHGWVCPLTPPTPASGTPEEHVHP